MRSCITACGHVGGAPEGKAFRLLKGPPWGWEEQGKEEQRRKSYGLDTRIEADVEAGKKGSGRKAFSFAFSSHCPALLRIHLPHAESVLPTVVRVSNLLSLRPQHTRWWGSVGKSHFLHVG